MAATPDLIATLAAVRTTAAETVADGTVPALVIGLTDRDGTLGTHAIGLADVASGRAIEPDTLFEIGSIGKTFTAIAAMTLVDQGRLDVDAPVATYLPWFRVPRTGSRITVHHLLSHTAGITAGVDGTPEPLFQVYALRRLAPGAAPGRRFHYSNVAFKAIGLILEAVTGQRYPDVIRERVLEPAGMHASEPEITSATRPRLATGYTHIDAGRIGHAGHPLVPATWLETATADGSIASTAEDMLAFARFLLAGCPGVLSPAAFVRMTTAVPAKGSPGYGYGIFVRDIAGWRIQGHGGGMVGYLSALQLDPAAGLGTVVLQTGHGGSPVGLGRRALAIARDALAGGARAGESMSGGDGPVELGGTWRADDGRSFALAVDGSTLRLTHAGGEVTLEAWDDDLYLAPDIAFDRFLLHVERPAVGDPWIWHGGERFVRDGTSVPPLAALPPDLAPFPGRYGAHDPWQPTFRVVARGDRLWLMFPTAPDGFDEQQPLIPRRDGSFRVGEDRLGPERLRFDTVIDGQARRAWLSGWDYYRLDQP